MGALGRRPDEEGTTAPRAPRPEIPSDDVIQLRDEYYIRASSSLADDRTLVLKQGETFAVFDRSGDIQPVGLGQQGLYHDATRYLSRLELRVEGERPILLSSTITDDNALVAVDLTNPHLRFHGERALAQASIHIFRSAVIWERVCYQSFRVRSYALETVRLRLSLMFSVDFADIFEVRGMERPRSGKRLEPVTDGDSVSFGYRGLDGVDRQTRLLFAPTPSELRADEVCFDLLLAPDAEETIGLRVACGDGAVEERRHGYEEAAAASIAALSSRTEDACFLDTSNEQFNDWLNRSAADLRMMLTETPQGRYPYAGIPWFNAPFGRDGIVTALETLWVAPSIAAAVLRYLTATQAGEERPESEAEPGKILHEARGGEMCALGEVPFRRYYGTIDATPLFVVLAHAYFERTGDKALIEEIWPNLVRALAWIDSYGDCDRDGFIEYKRRTPSGLVNQGWKDSNDSVFHADGTLAEGPIALCEVQAYVYGAKHGGAALADALGDARRAEEWRSQAETLREHFEQCFWSDEIGSYVLALDGQRRPCRVQSSNAGQCLLTGIASPARAAKVAATLMDRGSFSGWGIRTVSDTERRYNPMSYHNGSVWPHDNALIAAGLDRYGLKEPVLRILTGLFDASLFVDMNRLPELFGGFSRRPREGPTLYPVACAPQAWASGAIYLLLQACLGITISARANRVLFRNPVLPPFLEKLRIRDLRVGESVLDLELRRHPDDVGIQVVRREGDIEVVIWK